MALNLTQLREEFTSNGLVKADLNKNPFQQFEVWMHEALQSKVPLANAMSLATADESSVSLRTVLLKSFDSKGFVFFTNYASKKSQQIEKNPQVSLLFPWLDLERQVKISGYAVRISAIDSFKYFTSRPKDSQLGAWASKQSSVIESRKMLLSQFESMKRKFSKGEVPLPDFWGGYLVVPKTIEFWQGRVNRLHDRFLYTKMDNGWDLERLAP
jgi:pyridoxamine 5'-phosphate oxidase